jgi:Cu/Ag efflux pump CusA
VARVELGNKSCSAFGAFNTISLFALILAIGLVVDDAIVEVDMPCYNETFKCKMIQKMTGPDAISANALSKKVDVPQATLSK